jgi:predicted double-glycine peptidase
MTNRSKTNNCNRKNQRIELALICSIFLAHSAAIAQTANLLRVPLMRQSTDYTCGVAALQAVLAYYGQDVREDILAKTLKANRIVGTRYKNIARYAEAHGVPVAIYKDMTIEQLEKSIREGHPVLCLIQAWADRDKQWDYSKDWNDGHYVVAVGVDSERVIFMDPSTAGHYAYIPLKEFEERWHDVDGKEKLNHFGMSFMKNGSSAFSIEFTPIE